MKNNANSGWLVLLIAAWTTSSFCQEPPQTFLSLKDPNIAAQLKRFVQEKQAQADGSTDEPAPGFAPFLAAAERGDWLQVSNTFAEFRRQAGQYDHSGPTDERLRGTQWQDIMEISGAFEWFGQGDEKYSTQFGREIINSIPPGSVYFGGTDPGRFVVTALCRSQVKGDPFFVLTQNALADSTYLQYLRGMYGDKISIPTAEDSQRCFGEYCADAQSRRQNGQLKPGEDVQDDGAEKVQVSGQVAVMGINGLLAKTIFDKNPARECYLEESYPIEWMYPQLEPYGLILKLNRKPAATLSAQIVRRDHKYWTKCVTPMIGGWLHEDTTVQEIAAFAKKTFERKNFEGFTGDPAFILSARSHRMFSKLRSSQAGIYAWRADHAVAAVDKQRLAREADFAFRQAWALCPYSPEAVCRYAEFLTAQGRRADALVVAATAAEMPGAADVGMETFRALREKLDQIL